MFYAVHQNSAYFLLKIVSKHLVHIHSLVLIVVLTISKSKNEMGSSSSQCDLTNLRAGITYSHTLLKWNSLNLHSSAVLKFMCKYWPCFRYPNNFKMTWKDFQHLVKLLLLVSALHYYRFLIHSTIDLKSTPSSKFYIFSFGQIYNKYWWIYTFEIFDLYDPFSLQN